MSGNICRCGTYPRIRACDQASRLDSGARHERSHQRQPPHVPRHALGREPGTAVGRPRLAFAADEQKYGADSMPNGWVDSPLVFVAIAEDARSRSPATARKMGQGRAHQPADGGCDELEAIGRRVRSGRRPATKSTTATRTPTARAACATSSSRCAVAAPPPNHAGAGRGRASGEFPSPKCERCTMRSCTGPRSARSATRPRRGRFAVARAGA